MVLKLVVGNLEGNKVKNEKKAQRLFSGALYLQKLHTMNVQKWGEGVLIKSFWGFKIPKNYCEGN